MSKDPLEEYQYKEKLELKNLEFEPAAVQKICCPSCSNPLPADHLNIQTNVAKCSQCDVIFSFNQQVEQLSNQHHFAQEVLQPEGVELNYFGDELDIAVEQPWGTVEIILLSILPLFVLIVSGIVAENFPSSGPAKLMLMAFWLISTIVYIGYFFIRKRHKIYLHVNDDHLYIERRPRKFVNDQRYAVQEIDQVYIKNVANANGQKGVGVYMIVNGVNGQKHVELVSFVNSRSKARYIEQEIERHLGIPNRKVPEEDA